MLYNARRVISTCTKDCIVSTVSHAAYLTKYGALNHIDISSHFFSIFGRTLKRNHGDSPDRKLIGSTCISSIAVLVLLRDLSIGDW